MGEKCGNDKQDIISLFEAEIDVKLTLRVVKHTCLQPEV
jgi:hypothetical protein